MTKPKLTTVCLLQDGDRVLLAMKKRGFGAGYWNGYGGKVEEGETIEEAARREVFEESEMVAEALDPRGTIQFTIQEPELLHIEMHVFVITKHSGDPQETEEMRPEWFSLSKLPFDHMWPADPFWMPEVLAGKSAQAEFVMQNSKILLTKTVQFS